MRTCSILFITFLVVPLSYVAADSSFTTRGTFQPDVLAKCQLDGTYNLIIAESEDQKIIIGTNQNDIIIGTDSQNFIFGRGGNDCLIGLAGDDFLFGGDDIDQCFDGFRVHSCEIFQ